MSGQKSFHISEIEQETKYKYTKYFIPNLILQQIDTCIQIYIHLHTKAEKKTIDSKVAYIQTDLDIDSNI